MNAEKRPASPPAMMPPESGLRRLIDGTALAAGVRLRHAITVHQFGTLFSFVRSRLGVSIVPASSLPPRGDRALCVRPLAPAVTRRVGLLTLGDRVLSPAAASFREIFKAHYAATARWLPGREPRPSPPRDDLPARPANLACGGTPRRHSSRIFSTH